MKLLFASIDFLPHIGGISLMTHHLANAFSGLGHDVWVFAPSNSVAGDGARYTLLVDDNAGQQPLEGADWRMSERPRLEKKLAELHAKFGFDHFIALHPYGYGQAMSAMDETARPPVSAFFHGLELKSQLYFQKRVQSIRQKRAGHFPTLRGETLRVARESDFVFVNSAYTKSLVDQSGRSTANVVGCGIPEETATRMSDQVPEFDRVFKRNQKVKMGLDPELQLIGSVGRLVPSKNVSLLIELVAEIPSAGAVIVGDGPERPVLEQLAVKLKIERRVHFAGRVSTDDKWDYLSAMDVFCLLSLAGKNGAVEGFGIAALEAVAAGTPVVVSNVGGLPEAILANETGIVVNAKNRSAVISSVNSLLCDDGLSASLVSSARDRIVNSQTWRHVAERVCKVWTQ